MFCGWKVHSEFILNPCEYCNSDTMSNTEKVSGCCYIKIRLSGSLMRARDRDRKGLFNSSLQASHCGINHTVNCRKTFSFANTEEMYSWNSLIRTRLFRIPRYFELKTIPLAFALQSCNSTIFPFPWEFKIAAFNCTYACEDFDSEKIVWSIQQEFKLKKIL